MKVSPLFLALVLLQQVLETPSFMDDAKIQLAARTCFGGHHPDRAIHSQAASQAPDLACIRQEMRSRLFERFGRHLRVFSHGLPTTHLACLLMLVSGTSLTRFSMFSMFCFVIFHVHFSLFKRAAICLTLEYCHTHMSTPGDCMSASDHDDPLPIKQTVLPLTVA